MAVGPYGPCQDIADQLLGAGYRGVIAPCAALEGELSLTLFGPRFEHHLPPGEDFDSQYVDADVIDVRLRRSAASPPAALVGQTRSRSADPETYEKWPIEATGLPAEL